MSDSLKQASKVMPSLVPLGALPRGTEWPVNKRGMTRIYPEPDWVVWLQHARVYTTEAACLSMGWCPTEWANWHQSTASKAQIREIARPYLDMLAKRADIFGNHPDAIVTVGEGSQKMIDLSSARRIACAEGWDMPDEFELPPMFVAEVSSVDPAVPPTSSVATSAQEVQHGVQTDQQARMPEMRTPYDFNTVGTNTFRHKLTNRSHPLDSIIALAEKKAVDCESYQSVWAALVAIAGDKNRPAPLLGTADGEGVKYKSDAADNGTIFYTKRAFAARFRRRNKSR